VLDTTYCDKGQGKTQHIVKLKKENIQNLAECLPKNGFLTRTGPGVFRAKSGS
jgi:predicted transcriptional regulator of viral defense system